MTDHDRVRLWADQARVVVLGQAGLVTREVDRESRMTARLHPEWNTQLSAVGVREVAMRRDSVAGTKAVADNDGEIARLFAAAPGTLYLLRPDLHIAGRWKTVIPGEILKTAGICLGSEAP